jgi:penicillin-binding protein A
VNRSIVRLFAVVILMFTVLVVWTSRWTVFSATALDNNGLNKLQFFASLKVKRGEILADDGHTVLAKSVRQPGGTWKRVYPYGGLYSQVVGYSFPELSQPPTGLESAHNSALKGLQSPLTSIFGSFNGTPTVGDDLYSTIDPTAQALARQLLEQAISQDHAVSGSVVAIVPQTGAVKVLYSIPSYNDNTPDKKCKLPRCSQYFDALSGGYPPGSTFKLVTTAAALNSGKYTPLAPLINGHGPITVSGAPLSNDSGEEYGYVNLTQALTDSINVVYAQVGLALGARTMQQYMKRFGFYSVPPLDFPADEMRASGEYDYATGKLLLPASSPCTKASNCVDLGRMSIGQDKLEVTPFQMAMVVSAIADDGKLMQPRLTSKVVNSAGQTVETTAPQEYDQVMKAKMATELQAMMRDVVEEGTGTAANLEGLNIGGKTGTASTGLCAHGQPVDGNCLDGQPLDDAWFVGFPERDPKIAVAVELTDIPNGYGGQFAAPIAAKVIQRLLAENQ